jgi:hypothetical protein
VPPVARSAAVTDRYLIKSKIVGGFQLAGD